MAWWMWFSKSKLILIKNSLWSQKAIVGRLFQLLQISNLPTFSDNFALWVVVSLTVLYSYWSFLDSSDKLLLQKEFLDMFHYKNLIWLMDDSYVTRRRLVNGSLQESLLDQVLVSNVDISRDLNIVSPLGKSDHLGILFEVKRSNNLDTITN